MKTKKTTNADSAANIRSILLEEIENVRRKKTPPGVLNSIRGATQAWINTYKLELEVCKLMNRKPVGLFAITNGKAT